MEAKTWQNTVMSPSELGLHLDYYSASEISVVRVCCEAQAEISFKAGLEQGKNLILSNNNMADILHQAKQEGIREVVGIAEPYLKSLTDLIVVMKNLSIVPTETTIRNIAGIWLVWQAKLKEWDIK